MNIPNILCEIVKKVSKNKNDRLLYAFYDGFVFYSPDGFVMYKIPENSFLLNATKTFGDRAPCDVKRVFRPENSKPAVMSADMRFHNGKTLVAIENDESRVWINQAFLKKFNKNCGFLIGRPIDPVYIVEKDFVDNEDIVGLILPVRVKEATV